MEIPSDPGSAPFVCFEWHVFSLRPWEGSLSIKELKELLTALGIDHDGCLEKACKDKFLFSCPLRLCHSQGRLVDTASGPEGLALVEWRGVSVRLLENLTNDS